MNSTTWLHIAQITIGIIILGAITFQIVRPTNNQKTVVQAGGTKTDYWQGSTVNPGFGGCVTIQSQKPEIK